MRFRLDARKGGMIAAAVVAIAALVVVMIAAGDGGDPPEPVADGPAGDAAPGPGASEPEPDDERELDPAEDDEANRGGRESDPFDEPSQLDEDDLSDEERAAAWAVRAYVNGLDDRDSEAVCDLMVAGAIDEVDLPRRRGGCGPSLRASIGYRDPRGLPVWETARVEGLLTVALEGERASVTATTVTRFADRDEPSIEDDVVHLVREGGRWLVAKPSATLYRAVGIADVPPRVLAPPE